MSTQLNTFANSFQKVPELAFFRAAAERVRQFNYIAGGTYLFGEDSIAFQKSLVKEELLTELLEDGLLAEDRVLTIDALCDIFVVATYWSFQTSLNKMVEAEEGGDRSIDSILEWAIRDSYDALSPGLSLSYNFIQLVNGMVDAYHEDRPHRVVSDLVAFMMKANFDYRKALTEVLDSNDSKIPTVAQFIRAASNRYGIMEINNFLELEAEEITHRNAGRYTNVTGKLVNGRVVFKDGNGKIMKPLTYFEANLQGL